MSTITAEMSMRDVLVTISGGNTEVISVMMEMLKENPMFMLDVLLLDNLEICGYKVYLLWNDCCKRDIEKFKATITAFREGKFAKEEIHENLNQTYAKPFI